MDHHHFGWSHFTKSPIFSIKACTPATTATIHKTDRFNIDLSHFQ